MIKMRQGFIKEKLFEEQTLVEPLTPWFSELFVTSGHLCGTIREALLLLLEFSRLPKDGAIRG